MNVEWITVSDKHPNHPFDLQGKTILVTGASSGIGQEVAVQCSRMGATLILCGRDAERLQRTQQALLPARSGAVHRTLPADLGDAVQRQALADQCGPIDGIVHSAGVAGVAPIKMLSEAFLQRVMHLNYEAPLLLTQRLLQKQSIRPGGSILFMTSIAAHTGTHGVGPYSGSKAALIGSMRPLALELAKRGVRVNSISPGLVDTPLVNRSVEWLQEQAKSYPLGIGKPEDVAWACIYFLSDASRKVTGTTFHIDGGITSMPTGATPLVP